MPGIPPLRPVPPALVAMVGAVCASASAVLVALSGTTPATAATFRCLYAVPPLAALAWLERRRLGRRWRGQPGRGRPGPAHTQALTAGVFFAIDLVLWHHAIPLAGAGLGTVLGNLQVIFVGLGAWLAFGERPGRRMLAALPIVVAGVVAISGVIGAGAYGPDPVLAVGYCVASSAAYALYILVLRGSGSGADGPVAGPLLGATAVAALVSAALGLVPLGPGSGINLVPSWPAHGWLVLLALSAQVAGWSLISWALRLLPAALTALLLLVQPVTSVALSTVVLSERPSAWQLAGCVAVLAGVAYAASGQGKRRSPAGAGEEQRSTTDVAATAARARGSYAAWKAE